MNAARDYRKRCRNYPLSGSGFGVSQREQLYSEHVLPPRQGLCRFPTPSSLHPAQLTPTPPDGPTSSIGLQPAPEPHVTLRLCNKTTHAPAECHAEPENDPVTERRCASAPDRQRELDLIRTLTQWDVFDSTVQ